MIQFIINLGKVILEKDPATRSLTEAILFSPGLKAQVYHRLAHHLYNNGHFFFARLLSHRSRRVTGIEIHPGAVIGRGLFIDHGMGVVIGQTAIVGNDVTLFHGVTLGGVGGDQKAKRHTTVEDGALIGAGAKILGNVTIGKEAKIGANAVVLKDVPAYSTAVGVPARIIKEKEKAYLYVI